MAHSRLVSESLLAFYRVPGAVVTCVDDDQVRTLWCGKSDEGSGQAVVVGTRFQVASLSKIVTSWAAMRLVADGHIDLDEPVEPHLHRWKFPMSPYASDEITLRSLLTHTSGLPAGSSHVFLARDQVPSLVEALNGVGGPVSATPDNPAGRRFRYSNLGYTVVELLIEDLTGETFTDWTSKKILGPLGMVNSSFDRKWIADPATAAPHKRRGHPMPRGYSIQHAAGGLVTSGDDLAHLAQAMMTDGSGQRGGGVIPSALVEAMWQSPPAASELFGLRCGGYGAGQMWGELGRGVRFVGNQGSRPGWRSLFLCLPDERKAVAVLTNADSGLALTVHIALRWLHVHPRLRLHLHRMIDIRRIAMSLRLTPGS